MNWATLLSDKRINQKQTIESQRSRSAFDQDYDRIIFSHPFRRLQDKTQVHPLPEQDFVHTRLTHSLEVSSVGRSLGKSVGEIIIERNPELSGKFTLFDFGAIVAAASLAHDLGNPPFGHAGEDAISDFFKYDEAGKKFQSLVSKAQWEDLTKFEGNAQGFRILNKNQYGLTLTYASLGAFTKYPCPARFPERDKSKKSQKKYGFFQSEQQVFHEVANDLGLIKVGEQGWSRHPLAFLVEAADDICYSIIDLEDGCSLGLVPFNDAKELFSGVISTSKSKLGKLQHLRTLPEKTGFLRALAIGDLMQECANLFVDNEKDILAGKFDKALADECASSTSLKNIIDVSIDKIYRARSVVQIEASGHEVLPGLLREFTVAGSSLMTKNAIRKYQNLQKLLPEDVALSILAAPEDHYNMLRQITDFISGMTDRHALSLFRKIKGISL